MKEFIIQEVLEVCTPIVEFFKPHVGVQIIDQQLRLQFGRVLAGTVADHVKRTAPTATTYRRYWQAASLEAPFLSIALLVLSQLAISEASVERGFAILESTITEARKSN